MNNSRILLIEDDQDVRTIVKCALSDHNFDVTEAPNCHLGMRLAVSHSPAIVLLDLGLPDADGVELIPKLVALGATVLVLSARGEELQKVAALDAGADDYLTKPFGVPELLARVRAHLRRINQAGTETQGNFCFGDITVDLNARLVYRNGAPIHLTPIEFKLLSAMLINAGRVMTHTEMLRQAWGNAYQGRTHYLRIHMAHLRQKLEANPTQPKHFITETGVGYRFRP